MLYAIGFKEEDFKKAQVGIVSMGWDGNPCNMHLNDLSTTGKKSVNDVEGLDRPSVLYDRRERWY
jgi:dihydroxy-acid dehydratase